MKILLAEDEEALRRTFTRLLAAQGHEVESFANGSGNSLDRSRAHVADREDSGQGGFERPLNVRARADKAAVIECHTRSRQPSGMRLGADEQKQMSDRALYFFAGSV